MGRQDFDLLDAAFSLSPLFTIEHKNDGHFALKPVNGDYMHKIY